MLGVGVIRRIVGVVLRPRTTFAALVGRPVWIDTWLVILAVVTICAALLLISDIGVLAVVDERERVVEAFGGTVDDTEHAALLENPPYWV